MNIILGFENEILDVLDEVNTCIYSYPSPLKEHGIKFLEKLNLLKNSKERSCEAYILIPFWLNSSFSLDLSKCKSVSIATIFSVLYFMTQDEVMDSSSYKGHLLPLSSKFYYEFIKRYHSLFKSYSLFWKYFELYIHQWSYSVLWERMHHREKISLYNDNDLILLSRKTAGIKIPFAALCLIANKEQYIQKFSDMVDYDQIVYQFYDDWRDWRKDLQEGNYTYVLVEAMKYLGFSNFDNLNKINLDESLFNKVFFDERFLNKYFKISQKYNKLSAEAIKSINIPTLNEYILSEARTCILEPIEVLTNLKYSVNSVFDRFISTKGN